MTTEQIARVCHEANKAYCESIGDFSQKSWDDAEEWQRKSAITGVEFKLTNPDVSETSLHDSWMWEKLKDGWQWGEVKDAKKKTHPCLVPYLQLPIEQQKKDTLFSSIVDALK